MTSCWHKVNFLGTPEKFGGMWKVGGIKISKLSIYEPNGLTKLTTENALQPNFLQWKSVSSLIGGAASVPDDI